MISKYLHDLRNLKETSKPLWGKMSAQHMVEHLILAVQMSNGKLKLECFNPKEKLPALKRFLLSERPLPKLFINPIIGEELKPFKYSSLDEAKQKLKEEIDDYLLFFDKNPEAKPVNVTFGELNNEEWEVFHRKHFTHHLAQFDICISKKG